MSNNLDDTTNEIDIEKLHAEIPGFFRAYRDKQLSLAGNIDVMQKHDGSDVTGLDVEIEDALKRRLSHVLPGIVVKGEESGYGVDFPQEFGLIDPIDGTTSFAMGTPTWTNMFAYIRGGRVEYSVVYNPCTDNMYHAVAGEGSYKNGINLELANVAPTNVVLCKQELIEPLRQILGETFEYQVPPSGGGHGLTMVAEGKVVARFQLLASGAAHDYAPGGLLVAEAGGYNIPINDDKYWFGCTSFVACHPTIADTIQANIEQIRLLER